MKNFLIIQGPINSAGINGIDWVAQTYNGYDKSVYRKEFNSCLTINKTLSSNFSDYRSILAIYDNDLGYAKEIKSDQTMVIPPSFFLNDSCKAFTRASAIVNALLSIKENLCECNVFILRSDSFVDLEIAFHDLNNLTSKSTGQKKIIYTPYILKNRALSFNDFYMAGNGLDLYNLFSLVLKIQDWGVTSQHYVYSTALYLLNNPDIENLIKTHFSNTPAPSSEIFIRYQLINKFLCSNYMLPLSEKLFNSFELRGGSIAKNENFLSISDNFIFSGDIFNSLDSWRFDYFIWGFQGYRPTQRLSYIYSWLGFKRFIKNQLNLICYLFGL